MFQRNNLFFSAFQLLLVFDDRDMCRNNSGQREEKEKRKKKYDAHTHIVFTFASKNLTIDDFGRDEIQFAFLLFLYKTIFSSLVFFYRRFQSISLTNRFQFFPLCGNINGRLMAVSIGRSFSARI